MGLAQGRETRQNELMTMESKRVEVLGMGLQATNYAGGVKLLEELAQRQKPGMVAACNTQLVALAR
jgi:UDP-N-acetyl-D-mannosaminuronic acid transferase (WecB/TagA/CpsF family)